MPDHSHPYTNLPKQAFWKTAVAELDCRQIDLAWKPKAPVSREIKIITVGSCFAQHISKSLKENGFSWLDSEPAPAELPPAEHAKHGYGVFSFRTGNIYTAALLKQWVMWATGKAEQSRESFFGGGRYYDPFRPSLTPDGFSSAEEMLAARQTTLAAMLQAIKQADLFIFTLGLTEAWLNKDGTVYPMCPGTIRGDFSAEKHIFHNYNDHEVVRDLVEVFDELRGINPGLRFLLTVSPVPLTATASGQHVLTATTYSKSVLRSAAGYLTQTREDTDYFPSYELITAPAFKGQFFEPNMRSVSSGGVAFVMGQFLGAIGSEKRSSTPEISAGARAIAADSPEKIESGTDICDDIILETWINTPADDSEEPPNILLIGDSQMGMIAKVLDEQGIRYAGGAIMEGSEWDAVKFIDNDERIFTPLDSDAKARWGDSFNRSLGSKRGGASYNPYILCNIGTHSHRLLVDKVGLVEYFSKRNKPLPNVIDIADILDFLRIARGPHINLVSKFVQLGYRVIWLTDPPFQPENTGFFSAFDTIMQRTMEQVGCTVFNARDWMQSIGGARTEFSNQRDWIHGSPEYYRQLVKEIFRKFQIQTRHRHPA